MKMVIATTDMIVNEGDEDMVMMTVNAMVMILMREGVSLGTK